METTRQKKVGRLLQKELSNIFQKELQGAYPNALVTLTMVRMSPDLSTARVYISILTSGDRDSVLTILKSDAKKIRGFLGKRVGKHMRIVPDIDFFIDDTLDYVQKMEDLMTKLDIPPAPENDGSKEE